MGELKCFHSSKIASFLAWVEVSCSAKEHLISKSTDDYLVNRLSFSPCPHGTPKFTRVVKWRNSYYCRRGNKKRMGEDKSENKLFQSHTESQYPNNFKGSKNPCPEIMEKEDVSCFLLP